MQEKYLKRRVRFQMPPKTHRMHAVYVLVKSVVPKVPWSLEVYHGYCLWIKCLSLSETYQNCGGGDVWCCHLSYRRKNRTPAFEKWVSHIRSNIPLCLKSYTGLGLPSGTRQHQKQQSTSKFWGDSVGFEETENYYALKFEVSLQKMYI